MSPRTFQELQTAAMGECDMIPQEMFDIVYAHNIETEVLKLNHVFSHLVLL